VNYPDVLDFLIAAAGNRLDPPTVDLRLASSSEFFKGPLRIGLRGSTLSRCAHINVPAWSEDELDEFLRQLQHRQCYHQKRDLRALATFPSTRDFWPILLRTADTNALTMSRPNPSCLSFIGDIGTTRHSRVMPHRGIGNDETRALNAAPSVAKRTRCVHQLLHESVLSCCATNSMCVPITSCSLCASRLYLYVDDLNLPRRPATGQVW